MSTPPQSSSPEPNPGGCLRHRGDSDNADAAPKKSAGADSDSDDSDIVDLNNPRPPKPYIDLFFRYEHIYFLRSRLSRYQSEYIRGREEKTRVISEIYAQYCRLWPEDVQRCPNFCYQSLRSRIADWLNSRRYERTWYVSSGSII